MRARQPKLVRPPCVCRPTPCSGPPRCFRRSEGFRLRDGCACGATGARPLAGREDAAGMRDEKVEEELIASRVQEAARVLDDIIKDVWREMYLTSAVRYANDEEALPQEDEIIAEVVRSRLGTMEPSFLGAMDAYARNAKSVGGDDLEGLIDKIRQEVLRQLTQRFPKEVIALERVLDVESKEERVDLIREAAQEGGDSVVNPQQMRAVADQFINDLESQKDIVDRKLLAKLCLVREESRLLEMEMRFTNPGALEDDVEALRTNVYARATAFLQQVMRVADSDRRLSLLEKAFYEDWEGAAPGKAGQVQVMGGEAPDFVRPGNFMTTLTLTQRELDAKDEVPDAVKQRVEDIRREALMVLREMAWGRKMS
ncbi:unnamed protein product [Ostreobium quekettii]|uniref:Uncharacterized protein n=1 Tax=Ostreobium quekettii TaxID=121088 RepID=A0A8S1IVY2_9CHLO|nr:unnamed protein product [Ostreobium quekettii]